MFKVLISILLSTCTTSEFTTNDIFPSTKCTCVPFYQCSDETGDLITDGKGLMEFRNFDEEDSPCTGYFDVCCNAPQTLPKNDEPEGEEKPTGCGFHTPGVFPWSGALLQREQHNSSFIYKCGTSLIHKNVAITAAHCVPTSGTWIIRIGDIERTVREVVIHPHFNSPTLQNDIALLVLEKPATLSDKVGVICIPPPATAWGPTECAASSWMLKSPRMEFRPLYRIIKLPLVPREDCTSALRGTRLGQFFKLHRSFLCAGGEANRDTCGGDGGAPLICPVPSQPGRYHQVGMVSWGIGCGESRVPGVYVNVAVFRDWIDEVVSERGFDVTSYRY